MKNKKKYEKPVCKPIKYDTQSTTVVGNCTHWKDGGSPDPFPAE